MVDNFELIKPFLRFEDDKHFYCVQVIQRRKDDGKGETQHKVIRDYYIYSMESFLRKTEEIKKLCEVFNARAYIRLSRRDNEQIAKKTLIELGEAFKNNSFKHLSKVYSTAVGRDKGLDSLWLIDIDGEIEEFDLNRLKRYINALRPTEKEDKIVLEVPTKNGRHLITTPFDLDSFKREFKYDVHKNNPTLLYCL